MMPTKFNAKAQRRRGAKLLIVADELPRGVIVGSVTLLSVKPVEKIENTLTMQEREFGDYTAGRFAWEFAAGEILANPIQTLGSLGLWVPNEVTCQLLAAQGISPPFKTLSLTQPWASLVIWGEKRLETRSWSTNYRGTLLIHAAKGIPGYCRELCQSGRFRHCIEYHLCPL